MKRLFLLAPASLATLLLAALLALPAFAAGETPPGFLPLEPVTAKTWAEADALCKNAKGSLPTAAQLQELAAQNGDGSYGEFGWPDKTYWTRESGAGKYYAVPMETGKMELFTPDRLNAVVCGYGAGAPRKAAKPLEGFAAGVAPTSMGYQDAARWCERRGKSLPQADALKAVAGKTGDASYKANEWPEGMFWTRETGEGGHRLVHLGNGMDAVFPDTDKHWVTCTD